MTLMEKETAEALKELNKPCDCGLKPDHTKGMHDWCCQNCGGRHHESICPLNQVKK